jgi:hypothetical protein
LILIFGCAGPIAIPLGLGPGWDEFAGAAILGLVAAFAYQMLQRFLLKHRKTTNPIPPLDIVRERYARGDIGQD